MSRVADQGPDAGKPQPRLPDPRGNPDDRCRRCGVRRYAATRECAGETMVVLPVPDRPDPHLWPEEPPDRSWLLRVDDPPDPGVDRKAATVAGAVTLLLIAWTAAGILWSPAAWAAFWVFWSLVVAAMVAAVWGLIYSIAKAFTQR